VERRGSEYHATPEINACIRIIAAWLCSSKRGLLLTGNCGTGKSIFLNSIQKTLEYYNGKPLKTTYTGVPLPVFFNAIDLARDAVDDADSFALMCRHYPVIVWAGK
jgi:DNA replication protein DnaC